MSWQLAQRKALSPPLPLYKRRTTYLQPSLPTQKRCLLKLLSSGTRVARRLVEATTTVSSAAPPLRLPPQVSTPNLPHHIPLTESLGRLVFCFLHSIPSLKASPALLYLMVGRLEVSPSYSFSRRRFFSMHNHLALYVLTPQTYLVALSSPSYNLCPETTLRPADHSRIIKSTDLRNYVHKTCYDLKIA